MRIATKLQNPVRHELPSFNLCATLEIAQKAIRDLDRNIKIKSPNTGILAQIDELQGDYTE